MVTRVPVLDVRPQVEGGRFAVKAVEGEEFTVRARVFGEGRAVVRARVLLVGPDGVAREPVPMVHVDNDHWAASLRLHEIGPWTYAIESWHDPVATWVRDAGIKLEADVDVEVTLAIGAQLLNRARHVEPAAGPIALHLYDEEVPALERFAAALELVASLEITAVRDHVDATDPLPVFVDRERALVGAWYELFPRSEGAERQADGTVRPGTLRTANKRLEAVAAMGFDVVYLPPVHPIGRTARKGPGNALTAGPDDPGSPWAIGSSAGGHDAIEPALGTLEDFDAFVERAHQLGLEVALDLALQCSPDHPWVTEHPEWFVQRPDGTIAHAENPPKTYEDIYPLDFDADPEGLRAEVERVVRHWMAHGVRIFRVDNPHTKPLSFWERLLADVRATDPDVVFLSEAFTVPAMLHALGTVGFHQSYTYITWREGSHETIDYLDEVAHRTSDVMRPNFFVNTPDILPRYLQGADASMFRMRAVLAATGSPSWGMYAGYELLENEPAGPDTEEYAHSEKYEIKVRDWDAGHSIAPFVTRLNEVRRRHVSLQRLRNLARHGTDQAGVIAYSRLTDHDVVLVVVDLFPAFRKQVRVHVSAEDLGLPAGTPLRVRDELDGSVWPVEAVELSREAPARVLVIDA